MNFPVQDLYDDPILRPDGTADKKRVPKLSDERLIEFLRLMHRARIFDERAFKLSVRKELGIHTPMKGQEATQVGSAAALEADDWVVPSYREHAVYMTRGVPLSK